MEEWRDIKNFPGYQISNRGNIRSFYKAKGYGGGFSISNDSCPKVLSTTKINQGGHLRVYLYKNGKKHGMLVHRLVAEAFVDNPNSYPIVRHMNDNPEDNRANNLKWGTQRDNVRDACSRSRMNYKGLNAYNNKRKTPIRALNIKTNTEMYFDSQNEASRKTGISQGNVWNHLQNGIPIKNYIFKYLEKEIV